MHAELSLDSQQIAIELHALLQQLDPSRLTSALYSQIHQRSAGIGRQIEAALRKGASSESNRQMYALKSQLSDIADIITSAMTRLTESGPVIEQKLLVPNATISSAKELRAEYLKLRETLQKQYQQLSVRLAEQRVAVPALRPTNYKRSLLHATSGLVGVLSVELLLTPTLALWVAIVFSSYAWITELARRVSPDFNKRVMAFYGAVAHPHEHHRINSATWYCSALLILATCFEMYQIAIALAVLGFADPAAALIGRRFGKVKLINNRTLEGTLTFVATGLIVSLLVMGIWHHNNFTLFEIFVVSLAASCLGAVGELFAGRLDDNILTPVAAAVGAYLASLAL